MAPIRMDRTENIGIAVKVIEVILRDLATDIASPRHFPDFRAFDQFEVSREKKLRESAQKLGFARSPSDDGSKSAYDPIYAEVAAFPHLEFDKL